MLARAFNEISFTSTKFVLHAISFEVRQRQATRKTTQLDAKTIGLKFLDREIFGLDAFVVRIIVWSSKFNFEEDMVFMQPPLAMSYATSYSSHGRIRL